jgi:Spy/CpxP family protein refolding chaperone
MTAFTTKHRVSALAGAGLLAAVLGTTALTAWAQPFGGHGRHGDHAGMGGPGMGMMMGRGLDRMLDGVNATTEQRTQIKTIAEAARADLKAQHEANKGLREKMAALFTQPTVDANAVEALRAQMLAQHDQASRRITQAMLDVSRVLTPEQRQQIAERMQQRREMMQRHFQERRSLEGGGKS